MAELALNNRILIIIKESAFYANYGRYLNFFNTLRKFPQIDAILKKINNLKRVYKEFLKNIEYQQKKRKSNIKKNFQLKKGNKIYLFIKNLKILRLSKKLDYKKIGLFYIEKRISNINYKLNLPESAQIYFIFYISLLELAHLETLI